MKRTTLILSFIFILTISLSMGALAQTDTVKIGLSAPLTGDYAEYGENFQYSVQIAADEINAEGGIRGKEVEIVVRDSQGNPAQAAAIAQEFVNNQDIVAEIGDFTSTACLAAAPIYESAGMVQLSPTSSHPDFAPSGEYMFGIVGTQAVEGPFNVKELALNYLGLDSSAVIYINNDWGVATMENFVASAERNGLEITGTESFMEGETDYSAILTNLERDNPDGIYIAAMYQEASQIVREIDRMDWDVELFGPSSVFSMEFLKLAGEAGEGFVTNTIFYWEEDRAAVQNYVEEFEKRAGRRPNLHAAVAYDSMNILADAIERGGFDRSDIRDALAETGEYMGVTGKIKFTDAGDVVRDYLILKVVDNDWKVIE